MKLEKAIKILDIMGTPEFDGHTEDIFEARILGIEALKREIQNRRGTFTILLPGETPEE